MREVTIFVNIVISMMLEAQPHANSLLLRVDLMGLLRDFKRPMQFFFTVMVIIWQDRGIPLLGLHYSIKVNSQCPWSRGSLLRRGFTPNYHCSMWQ